MQIGQNPKILLSVETKGGRLISSRLSLADAFLVEGDLPEEALLFLKEYAARKNKLPPFPYALGEPLTRFQKTVLETLAKTVSFGETVSYQELAELSLCSPLAARAVGAACGKNPLPFWIPCHRVVRKGGAIGGFSLPLEIKQRLLAFERS